MQFIRELKQFKALWYWAQIKGIACFTRNMNKNNGYLNKSLNTEHGVFEVMIPATWPNMCWIVKKNKCALKIYRIPGHWYSIGSWNSPLTGQGFAHFTWSISWLSWLGKDIGLFQAFHGECLEGRSDSIDIGNNSSIQDMLNTSMA